MCSLLYNVCYHVWIPGGIRGLFTGRDSKKDSSGQTTSSGASSTPSDVSGGGRTVSRHVREERGPGGYVKTIVTETVVDANGRKTTTTTESVKSGDSDGAASADVSEKPAAQLGQCVEPMLVYCWSSVCCITFIQCWTIVEDVEDVGPTLYKCYRADPGPTINQHWFSVK